MSRVDPTAIEEDIKNHIPSKGVSNFEFVQLSHEESLWKSFKLTADIRDRDTILNPVIWPEGVSIQKWKVKYNGNHNG